MSTAFARNSIRRARRWLSGLLSPSIDLTNDAGLALAEQRLATHADERLFQQLNALKASRQKRRSIDYLRALYFLRANEHAAATEALKEELRFFPDHAQARALLAQLTASPSPRGESECDELLAAISSATMLGEARLRSLHELARAVCEEDLPGNFVECGVAAGGSSALLAVTIKRHSRRERRLFSCDTFSGMPTPGPADTHLGVGAEETGWGSGTCAAPVDSLRAVCEKLDVADLVTPVQGLFEETLPARRAEFGPIALLHMDGDWFSSTMAILENLYDAVVPGGRIQIDDYGHWEGCRQAVEEYTARRGLKFQLNKIDATGVWLVKQTH